MMSIKVDETGLWLKFIKQGYDYTLLGKAQIG